MKSSEAAVPTPRQDIASFTFDKQNTSGEDEPLLVDADDSSRFLTFRSCQTLVKRLVAGFQAYGLEPGDCVLTHLPNSVNRPRSLGW